MIKLVNVSKSYISKNVKHNILSDVNLSIKEGEILGIVGPSGAGKSTLIRLINGLIMPTSGDVFVGKSLINKMKLSDLNNTRHEIGMIFQHFNMINSLTVYENVLLNLEISNYPKEKRNYRIKEVLELVGLLDKIDNYPVTLSGGEKQRLGIARAISNNPKYLLCDEITSALDVITSKEIILLLKKIHRKMNITIIFVTHQIDVLISLVDRVVVISDGLLVEDKLVNAFLKKPEHKTSIDLVKNIINAPNFLHKEVHMLVYDNNTNDTSISNVIKLFNVDVNILFWKTLSLKNGNIGYLFVEISGENKNKALNYLKNANLEVSLYA